MKKTLYISRPLLNVDEIRNWAKQQGFESTLEDGDMHVTIVFSKKSVEWPKPVTTKFYNETKNRKVEQFGDAIVLVFPSKILKKRWQSIMGLGASWDFPSYISHVTISYELGDLNLEDIEPYTGMLKFGPEKFNEIEEDWADNIEEDDL